MNRHVWDRASMTCVEDITNVSLTDDIYTYILDQGLVACRAWTMGFNVHQKPFLVELAWMENYFIVEYWPRLGVFIL